MNQSNDIRAYERKLNSSSFNQNQSAPKTHFYRSKYKAKKIRERDSERTQDVSLRNRIKDSIFSGLRFQKWLRLFLAIFYVLYILGTTFIIFWVILHQYPASVKTILAGVCLANILSILAIMYKFSFAPIKDMIDEFNKIGGNHWK